MATMLATSSACMVSSAAATLSTKGISSSKTSARSCFFSGSHSLEVDAGVARVTCRKEGIHPIFFSAAEVFCNGGHVVSVGVPGAVSSRHLVWVGQKNKKKTSALPSSSPVLVAAAATVIEEAAVPSVTTETVPRPTKVGKGIVRLRLTRLGRKKRPFYRIVATHSSWRRDGKYIELLGHYNPLHAKDDLGIVVKADRIKYWLGVGAQPSDTVTGILHQVGILKKVEGEQ